MEKQFPRLNLPPFELRIEEKEGHLWVFDIIRKKMVALTPEEWVRQHFVHLLVKELAYPRSLIRTESGLTYFKSAKRSDIMIRDRNGQPFMLVECKSYKLKLGRAALEQLATYNKVIHAPFVAITNGLHHFCWQKKQDQDSYDSLENFPGFPE